MVFFHSLISFKKMRCFLTSAANTLKKHKARDSELKPHKIFAMQIIGAAGSSIDGADQS